MLFYYPKVIENQDELEQFTIGQRVIITGEITETRTLRDGRQLLLLDNGILLACSCQEELKNRDVTVLGVIEEFQENKQIEILRMVMKD